MRVLLMPASYPPVLGGLQTTVHALARQLINNNHRVAVVTNHYPCTQPQHEMLEGVDVRRWLLMVPNRDYLQHARPDLFVAACAAFPLGITRLARLVQQFRPNVVNVHFPDAQVPFVIWLRRHFAFRLVVSLHGDEVDRWFPDLMTHRASPKLRWLRSLLGMSDAVTACSRFMLDRAIQIEPSVASKGFVIHNGVDLQRFETTTSHIHPRPYILAFGRLTYKKGFDLLLQAYAHLPAEQRTVDLLLVGEGEQRDALLALTHQLGIEKHVRILKRAPSEEIVRLLNGCQFAVMPSRQEPFGITALEVLAAGKPLLATRVGGIPEFVPQPPNLLVEPSVGALHAGLLVMLSQVGQTSNKLQVNREAAGKYTWQTALLAYTNVLEGASA
jgi:glycosyltransferase involved in cell wall biosynthesis